MLRYWDGAQWTAHTSPVPQPTVAPIGDHAISAGRRRPKGARAWNLRTVLVLLTCVALLIATPIVLFKARGEAYRAPAEAALNAFLAAAVQGDDSWRKHATPRLSERIEVGAPIGGVPEVAEAIGLEVDYELGELEFTGPSAWSGPDEYDLASAPIELTYTYEAYGERHRGTAEQVIWLARPFYYDSDQPERSKSRQNASRIGPWRVTGITLPDAGPNAEDDRSRKFFTSDLSEEYDTAIDGNICWDPVHALEELAEHMRVEGEVATNCVPREGRSFSMAEGIDEAEFAAGFPVIDALKPQFAPGDVVMLDPRFSSQLPPIMQYHVKTAGGDYVVTYASTELEGKDDFNMSARLIHIDEVGGNAR